MNKLIIITGIAGSGKTTLANLNQLSNQFFTNLLEESMRRKDENIIIEYPFDLKWKSVFEKFSKKYQYDAITINAMVENFDENWERIVKRDLSDERHPAHELSCYNPLYKSQYEKEENMDYDALKKENDTKENHQINLGKIIEFCNKNEKSLEEILRKMKE